MQGSWLAKKNVLHDDDGGVGDAAVVVEERLVMLVRESVVADAMDPKRTAYLHNIM